MPGFNLLKNRGKQLFNRRNLLVLRQIVSLQFKPFDQRVNVLMDARAGG